VRTKRTVITEITYRTERVERMGRMGRIERTERMGRRKEAPEIVRSERHLLEREGRSQRGRHISTQIERQRGSKHPNPPCIVH
jgi:hypothetical protein